MIYLLVPLALLGAARAALFVINRAVVGDRHENKRMQMLLVVAPPVLLALTVAVIPFARAFRDGRFDAFAVIGGAWFTVATVLGVWWLVHRTWMNLHPKTIEGVRSREPVVRPLRRGRMPYASLRKLGLHNDVYDLEITSHEVVVPDLPPAFDGFTIAFLSDTHVASFMKRELYRECIRQIQARQPDLVLLGGDYVTFRRDITLLAEWLLDGLTAPHGVYAVLGNHDYWADEHDVASTMKRHGVRIIDNEALELTIDGQTIDLIGIDEIYRGDPDLDGTVRAVGSRPVIAVSHHPDIVREIDEHRVDLLVCGHTHGGQIRFPFFGAVVVPSWHESRYASGFHRRGKVLMYVGRGIGAVPPVRILCRPELPFFTLKRG